VRKLRWALLALAALAVACSGKVNVVATTTAPASTKATTSSRSTTTTKSSTTTRARGAGSTTAQASASVDMPDKIG